MDSSASEVINLERLTRPSLSVFDWDEAVCRIAQPRARADNGTSSVVTTTAP